MAVPAPFLDFMRTYWHMFVEGRLWLVLTVEFFRDTVLGYLVLVLVVVLCVSYFYRTYIKHFDKMVNGIQPDELIDSGATEATVAGCKVLVLGEFTQCKRLLGHASTASRPCDRLLGTGGRNTQVTGSSLTYMATGSKHSNLRDWIMNRLPVANLVEIVHGHAASFMKRVADTYELSLADCEAEMYHLTVWILFNATNGTEIVFTGLDNDLQRLFVAQEKLNSVLSREVVDMNLIKLANHQRRTWAVERDIFLERLRRGVKNLIVKYGSRAPVFKELTELKFSGAKIPQADVVDYIIELLMMSKKKLGLHLYSGLRLLAQNKDYQRRMQIKMPHGNRLLGELNILRMPQVMAVVEETLRLTAPAYVFFLREVKADIEMNEVVIKKGTILVPGTRRFQKHRDDEYTLRFRPHTWEKKRITLEPSTRDNFLPFGAGSRNCPGSRYAKTILATFIAEICSKCEVELRAQFMEEPCVWIVRKRD